MVFEVSIVQSEFATEKSQSDFIDRIDRIGVASFPSFAFWATSRASRNAWWRSVIADREALVLVASRRSDGSPIGFSVCFVHEDGICLAHPSADSPNSLRILSMFAHPVRAVAYVVRKLRVLAFDHGRVEIEQIQPSEGREMFVDQFAVCPTARGEGVARGLLRATIEAAVDSRCDWLGLRVEAGNRPAINLYRSMGLRISKADRAGLRLVGAIESMSKNGLIREEPS